VTRIAVCVVAACLGVVPAVAVPAAHAGGDTHVTGTGANSTIDCNNSTLFIDGTSNTITALGTCYAVTIQGSGNTVIADDVENDITVYGWNETVLYKNGNPLISDVGRQLGMTNRIDRVPA
jgi:hypothetical protein